MNINKVKDIVHVYRQLVPISKSLQRAFEANCNYGDDTRRNTRIDNLCDKARSLAEYIGMDIYVQSDPRGCALYLVEKNAENVESTYSTIGIAIY